MLFLAAIAHLTPARVHQPDQGPLQANPELGHLSLTIVALVYVLVTVWRG